MAKVVSLLMLVGFLSSAYSLTIDGRSLKDATCPSFELPKLSPTLTTAPVADLQWVGADDQTVFAVTSGLTIEKGGLWRSMNGGATFDEWTAKLSVNSSETLKIMNLYAQKSNSNNVLILGTGSYMWLSNDKGENFSPVKYPGDAKGAHIRDVRFNPRRDGWLLVHIKRASCKVKDKAHQDCPMDLVLYKNAFDLDSLRNGWNNLTSNSNEKIAGFVDFDWGANLCPAGSCSELPPIADELILATVYARAEDYDQPWDKDVNFVSSTDDFRSSSTRVPCGNQLEIVGRSVYLAVANSCPNSPDRRSLPNSRDGGITLFTSMDGGNTFVRACLPAALKQEGYELVETHDGRGALVIVDFSVDTGMMMPLYAASVYAAGPHHALFSLSLTNVYVGMMGSTTDFTRLEGLQGIYVANQVVPAPSSDGSAGSTTPTGEMPMPMGEGGYVDYYVDPYYDLSDVVGEPIIETRITYSAGGRWQRIRVYPNNISNLDCRGIGPEPWYLHLNGMSPTNRFGLPLPGVYSNPSAPGLVLATGNVASLGSGLDQSSPELCTWISRDGGVTWADVAVGAYIYEFADWGGVIVMAKYPGQNVYTPSGLADEVLFSVDYGQCWQHVNLSMPIYVDNISIEPDGQQPVVILHGVVPKQENTNSTGAMYFLNVSEITKLPICNSPDQFETWSPPTPSGTGKRCVLGQQLELERRKQDRNCLYGKEYKRPNPKLGVVCNCTQQQDTECDYGFLRTNDSCVAIEKSNLPVCPVLDDRVYTVSDNGRRIVHGDVCKLVNGITGNTDGKGQAKPSGRTSSSGGGWVTALVLVLVTTFLVSGVYAWWRFRATEEQQETIREVAESVAAKVASAWGLLLDKISSIRFRSRGQGGAVGEEMGYFQPLGDPGYDMEGHGNVFTLK
ncbi:hypothetical protein VaNZ11_016826 [Volvox africanus]|uniref:VPS10 domain-containing protein n=1 Tax=Volvox africanus TaxID=51714 RepID=A0ABQ5SPK6_9CHLO|nr:hypothetical protein VaNZ11_016826 [Volvox africanus]